MTMITDSTQPRQKRLIPIETGAIIIFMLLSFYFAATSEPFRSVDNFRLLSKQMAELAIVATGMTFVIATGGIDISVGSVMAFCAMTLGWLITIAHWNPILACVSAIGVGSLCGFINGLLITRAKLSPIIVTLAMLGICRAGAMLFNEGNSLSGLPPELNSLFAKTNMVYLPVLFWIAILTLGIGALILTRTRFGREVLSIGGNRTAARLAGVNVGRVETLVYVLSGTLAGLAAIINVALKSTATPDTGQYMELTAITAVVLGGTSIDGGKATLLGTAFGVLAIHVILSGIRLQGREDQIAWFLIGIALLIAVEVQKRRFRT